MTEWNAILERVAPSVVALEIAGADGPFRTPGVAMPGGYLVGWHGLTARVTTPTDLLDIAIRQGERAWTGQMSSYRRDWAMCSFSISEPPPWPPIGIRSSASLAEGEEVGFVGVEHGNPTLIKVAPVLEPQFSVSEERPYERASCCMAMVDTPLESGALVIDVQGRLAGLVEADPRIPLVAFVLTTEYMTRLGPSQFVSLLVQQRMHHDAVRAFRDREASLIDDPWALCAAGQAFEALGDTASALRVWRRAAHLDPENAWPRQQVLRLGDDHGIV